MQAEKEDHFFIAQKYIRGGGGREGEEGGERERDCHSRGSRASVAEGGNFIKKE